MSERANRLLCCAVAYRNADVKDTHTLPDAYTSERDAINAMMQTLWFEAKASMMENIQIPDDAYLHPVDIDTDEPGIVASKTKQNEIVRRKAPLPNVVYERRPRRTDRPRVVAGAPRTIEEATADAEKRLQKSLKTEQTRARRELRTDERAHAKLEERAAKKRARENETKEERAERLAEARALREERRRKKEEKSNEAEAGEAEAGEAEAGEAEAGEAKTGEAPTNSDIVLHVNEMLETESEADVPHHNLMPTRMRLRDKKAKYFASPVPHDRHLCAMEQAGLADAIRDAILTGKESSAVTVIHGPPGTGKTRRLASCLKELPNARVFACAPTNVGTANLYARLLAYDATASLLVPASRIPPGTPVTSQDPHARVVCSTISGRAGPILDGEVFDTVLIDEAAQCMEAWVWCLLRPDVKRVIMTGDTHQLPALVSQAGQALKHGRSMMQRLLNLRYPSEFLSVQRRMHPEIVRFPNARFYEGRLSTEYTSPPRDDLPVPYRVVDVDGACAPIGTSFWNDAEVRACLRICGELEAHFEHVVIICPYQGQTRALIAAGARHVHTVDSFQGQEADAVVLSMVRNEDIGFWNDERRLNVSLTRAKHCLRVVGSARRWTGLLKEVTDDATRRRACE